MCSGRMWHRFREFAPIPMVKVSRMFVAPCTALVADDASVALAERSGPVVMVVGEEGKKVLLLLRSKCGVILPSAIVAALLPVLKVE